MHARAVFFSGNQAGNRGTVIRNILNIKRVLLQFAELIGQFLMRCQSTVINNGNRYAGSRKAQFIGLCGSQSVIRLLIGGIFGIGSCGRRQRQN